MKILNMWVPTTLPVDLDQVHLLAQAWPAPTVQALGESTDLRKISLMLLSLLSAHLYHSIFQMNK